jgi:hypothetical protein
MCSFTGLEGFVAGPVSDLQPSIYAQQKGEPRGSPEIAAVSSLRTGEGMGLKNGRSSGGLASTPTLALAHR